MTENAILYSVFLIFFGAAVLATVALYTRQSLLVAYILLGVILGPWGLNLVGDTAFAQRVGDIGIIFLLFLLGLNLHPQKLFHLLRKTSLVTLISSLAFAFFGFLVGVLCGFNPMESMMIGAAMMFSISFAAT